jgi:hypothetical protein
MFKQFLENKANHAVVTAEGTALASTREVPAGTLKRYALVRKTVWTISAQARYFSYIVGRQSFIYRRMIFRVTHHPKSTLP